MSDIVKIVFDGDLGPLQQKQALAKGELNTFVAESEAEIKGIASAGDVIGASAQKGAESFSRYYKPVINDVSRDIKALSSGFEKVLGATESKVARAGLEDLGYALKKLNNDGFEAAASSEVLKLELKSITKQLAEYSFELAAASQANIFFAETEVEAAAASEVAKVARGGGHGSRPLQGYGGIFRATGLTNAGLDETEANAALNIISKLGISTASLVAVGGVAALGAEAVLISQKINSEADKRLESEENIARAINKQVLGLKESHSDYQKILDQLHQAENLQKKIAGFVGSNDQPAVKAFREKTVQDNFSKVDEINRLQAEVAQNERSLAFEKTRKPEGALAAALFGGLTSSQQRENVNLAEVTLEKNKKRLSESEEALKKGTETIKDLDKASGDITSNQDKRFASNFEDFAKATEQKRRFAEQQAEKFAASVKAGAEQVARLVTGYKEEFDTLFLDAGKENPFVAQVVQSARALEALEQKLKGAGSELRNQAVDLQKAASAHQVYSLQLNSDLQTIDLRSQENRFRNPTQKELTDRFSDYQDEQRRTSNTTNPDAFRNNVLDAVKAGAVSKDEALKDLTAKFSGYSEDVILGFKEDLRHTFTNEQEKNQRVIDAKLEVAGRARTEDQKATSDAAVVAFAGGLNPDDLTKNERAKIADALERSAVRTENRQQKSLEIQAQLLATLKQIDQRGDTLNTVNRQGGKDKLDIVVKDETTDGIAVEKKPTRPSPQDTRDLYDPPVVVSGGALTNR